MAAGRTTQLEDVIETGIVAIIRVRNWSILGRSQGRTNAADGLLPEPPRSAHVVAIPSGSPHPWRSRGRSAQNLQPRIGAPHRRPARPPACPRRALGCPALRQRDSRQCPRCRFRSGQSARLRPRADERSLPRWASDRYCPSKRSTRRIGLPLCITDAFLSASGRSCSRRRSKSRSSSSSTRVGRPFSVRRSVDGSGWLMCAKCRPTAQSATREPTNQQALPVLLAGIQWRTRIHAPTWPNHSRQVPHRPTDRAGRHGRGVRGRERLDPPSRGDQGAARRGRHERGHRPALRARSAGRRPHRQRSHLGGSRLGRAADAATASWSWSSWTASH